MTWNEGSTVSDESTALPWPLLVTAGSTPADAPAELMARVARGDTAAFASLYDAFAPRVYGLIKRVLRNPAQSEEVTQEVMVEVWRTAARFDAERGSVASWLLTMAHRRAIDRVRSEQSATDRDQAVAAASGSTAYDEVSEAVTTSLEAEQVRHCLGSLTDLQRESVTLAYYGGYSYREVAELLDAKLATIKARMRDGLIRLRDCLGVEAR
ncbi:sigma-70 family RNA polymerase sigma factor [Kribbella deserti]|uniref:Sigma-70 family RNA polymerase sigma factor n=1 Tax=Kribbella deserti TaxID=1926257 RepID=A0ABV6QP46_9ACTN